MADVTYVGGDISARLRRGLSIRGAVSATVGDDVSLTAQVLDLTRAPFRQLEVGFMKSINSPALAANISGLKIRAPMRSDGFPSAVVEGLYLSNNDAAVHDYRLGWFADASAINPAFFAWSSEIDPFPAIGFGNIPVEVTNYNQAAPSAMQPAWDVLRLQPGVCFYIPLDIALRDVVALSVECLQVNVSMSAAWRGRWIPG